MRQYTNSEIRYLIEEHLHSKREREIAVARLIDGLTIEQLAEQFDMSPRHMQRIVNRIQTILFLLLG